MIKYDILLSEIVFSFSLRYDNEFGIMLGDVNVDDDISCNLDFIAVIWWNSTLFGTISRWRFLQRKEFCF